MYVGGWGGWVWRMYENNLIKLETGSERIIAFRPGGDSRPSREEGARAGRSHDNFAASTAPSWSQRHDIRSTAPSSWKGNTAGL